MGNNQTKKKHHYLPKSYLKRFTKTDTNTLWVYEKGSSIVRKSSPKNEGCQSFYHAFYTEEGTWDTNSIEDFFEKIETSAGVILKKIHLQETLTEQDRKSLSLFISFVLTRVPLFREEIEKMAAEYIKDVGIDISERNFKPTFNALEQELGISPDISREELTVLPSHRGSVFSLTQMFHIALDYSQKFLNLKWRFLFANTEYKYITSDNPLYFHSPDSKGPPHDDFLNNDIEMILPLSKEVALLATRYNIADGYGRASTQTIKVINTNTVLSALNNVYAYTDRLNNFVQRYKDKRPFMVIHQPFDTDKS